MTGRPPELLSVSIPLGPLTYSIEASHDVFHVQDPKTGEFKAYPLNPSLNNKKSTLSWVKKQLRRSISPLSKLNRKIITYGALFAITSAVLANVVHSQKYEVLDRLRQIAHILTAPSIKAEPAATLQAAAPAVAQVTGPYPMPLPMSVGPVHPAKLEPEQQPHEPPAKRETKTPTKEESLVVMNEATGESTPSKAESPRNTASQKPISQSVTYKPQLVAIQDEATILVTSPTSRIPVKVARGARMPDGRVVSKIDTQNGVVTLDSGSPLRLE